MFEGFTARDVETSATTIHLRTGGSGPPLLLLHGYPQCHVMWHLVAPVLAARFTVIAPICAATATAASRRRTRSMLPTASARARRDMVEAMAALGHDRFGLAGHDRGGRVAIGWRSTIPTRSSGWRCSTSRRPAPCSARWIRPRHRLLPLVLPDPAPRSARAADRGRPGLLSPQEARRLGGAPQVRARGAGRIRALLQRPGDDSRLMRGLPRRRLDRPRPR